MGVSFLAFGAGTANLVLVLQANVELLTLYGALAVMEGALWQLAQIIATAYASMLAWVIFKACEYRLVQGLTDPED
ncbi:MAG: hypothetical protein H7Z19_07905 [Chitinophagaceae bacterium]|nr:hypothetical protein [Rubrivivax sp.]